jgi:hypothetical protein
MLPPGARNSTPIKGKKENKHGGKKYAGVGLSRRLRINAIAPRNRMKPDHSAPIRDKHLSDQYPYLSADFHTLYVR